MLALISVLVFLSVLMLFMAVKSALDAHRLKLYRLMYGGEESFEESGGGFRVPFVERLEQMLRHSGIFIPAYRFIAYCTMVVAAMYLLGLFLVRDSFWALLFAAIGLVFVYAYLGRIKGNRMKMLDEQMDTVLNLMGGALRAGASLSRAVDTVAQETSDPASTEFQLVQHKIALGKPAAEALAETAEDIGNVDLEMMATAALIHSKTGGNLAEVIDRVAETTRERRSLRDTLKALTAEGRTTGYVIGAMPFVISGFFLIMNPGFFDPLLASTAGTVTMIICYLMVFVGIYLAQRISSTLDY